MKIGLRSKMSKDVIWTFTIQMTIMICAFVVTKILSNRLSVDDFGQYNLIKRSVQVLSFVMLAGVGIALPRYIPLYQKGEQKKSITPLLLAAFIYILIVSLLVCVICGFFSEKMQVIILGENGNNSLLLIAIAYAFTLAMAQYSFAYYRGTGDFKWYNGAQLAIQLAIIAPLVFLPFLTTTSVFLSWLFITAVIVLFYLTRELLTHKIPPLTLYSIKTELNTIIKYSSGRLVADFFLFSLSAFPLIYISNALDLQQTAYYSVGITFVTMVTPLYSFMGIILLPYISESVANHQLQKANQFVNKLALVYLLSSVAISAFIYIFINYFTSFFFSDNYLITTDLSRIMILAILPQAIYLLFRNPIDAISAIPYNTLILGVSLLVMILAFTHSHTIYEYAWAYFLVSLFQGTLSWLTWLHLKRKKV